MNPKSMKETILTREKCDFNRRLKSRDVKII